MANALLMPAKNAAPRATRSIDSTQVVEAHFDQLGRTGYWGSLYADITDPAVRWSFVRRQAILELLLTPLVRAGTRVVEIGPGTGNLVGYFAARGCEYLAFDTAPAMVDATNAAIAKNPGLAAGSTCDCADIHALPLDDGHADVVVAAGVLEYLDDPRRAMGELARITRRGPASTSSDSGVALITLPNSRSLNRIMAAKLAFLTNVAKRFRSNRPGNPPKPDVHRTAYTPTRFAGEIARQDWRLNEAHYYDVEAIPYPINRIAPRIAFAAKRQAESSRLVPKSLLANGFVLSLVRKG